MPAHGTGTRYPTSHLPPSTSYWPLATGHVPASRVRRLLIDDAFGDLAQKLVGLRLLIQRLL